MDTCGLVDQIYDCIKLMKMDKSIENWLLAIHSPRFKPWAVFVKYNGGAASAEMYWSFYM